MSTPAAAKNQASKLPEKMKGTKLPDIFELDEDGDFEGWEHSVRYCLRHFSLHYVIRTDLARPKETDPGYKVWEFYSTLVGGWLYTLCSETIRRQLNTEEDIFADDMFRRIEKIMIGRVDFEWITAKVRAFLNMKPTEYDSVGDYIVVFTEQLQKVRDAGVQLPWAYALVMLLEELDGELSVVKLKREEFKALTAQQITESKFAEICKSLRIASKIDEARGTNSVN